MGQSHCANGNDSACCAHDPCNETFVAPQNFSSDVVQPKVAAALTQQLNDPVHQISTSSQSGPTKLPAETKLSAGSQLSSPEGAGTSLPSIFAQTSPNYDYNPHATGSADIFVPPPVPVSTEEQTNLHHDYKPQATCGTDILAPSHMSEEEETAPAMTTSFKSPVLKRSETQNTISTNASINDDKRQQMKGIVKEFRREAQSGVPCRVYSAEGASTLKTCTLVLNAQATAITLFIDEGAATGVAPFKSSQIFCSLPLVSVRAFDYEQFIEKSPANKILQAVRPEDKNLSVFLSGSSEEETLCLVLNDQAMATNSRLSIQLLSDFARAKAQQK